jgi:hypothetical protein
MSRTRGAEGPAADPQEPPQTTPPETVGKIKALLALEGIRVSAITIQKILNDSGLGTRYDRWLALQADLNAWLIHHNTERPHHAAEIPPFTLIPWPVILAAPGPARNTASGAISTGVTTPSLALDSAFLNSLRLNSWAIRRS